MTETLAQPPLTEAAEGPGIPGISAAELPVSRSRPAEWCK